MKYLVPFFTCACAIGLFAADPGVGYLYPAGVCTGTTVRILVGGQFFGDALGAFVTGGGVESVKLERVPSFPVPGTGPQRTFLRRWLDSIENGVTNAPSIPDDPHITEWRSNSWWRVLDTLDRGQRELVERDLFIPRNSLQASPALRQMLFVTLRVAPGARPGRRAFHVWSRNGISAPHPFDITASCRCQEPPYSPPHRPRPADPLVTDFPCTLDGRIMPGQTDIWRLRLPRGRRLVATCSARVWQPYVGDAVPGFFNATMRLVAPDGRELAFADDHAWNPDPVLECVVPEDGEYRLEVRDNLYRGREDFVYAVEVALDVPRPPLVSVPAGAERLTSPARVQTLEVARPGRHVLEVVARRKGSPLDPVLTLRGPRRWWGLANGDVLARCDDVTNAVFIGTVPQAECDPVLVYDFPVAGRYEVEVRDRNGRFGPDCFYTFAVREEKPEFEVWSSRSSFALPQGWKCPLKLHVLRRGGFDGPLALRGEGGVSVEPNVIPAGTNLMSVAVRNRFAGRDFTPREVRLVVEGKVNGEAVSGQVHPADEAEQAFAWTHLVPAARFTLKPLPQPKPLKKGKGKGRK